MQKFDNLSDEAMQSAKLVMADGSVVTLTLRFNPALERWVFDISRNEFSLNGLNICVHPNLLRPWRNIIPFGLACTSTDGVDPTLISDFLPTDTGDAHVVLYLLDSTEVEQVEETILEKKV